MNPAVSKSDGPHWSFPKTWQETKKVVKEALSPRVRGDEVSLNERPASIFNDILAVTQFAGSGILYKRAGKKAKELNDQHPPLADAPKVRLHDPLVIVPGWGTVPEKFDTLIEHLLSSGQNGDRAVYLKDGQPFADKSCSQATVLAATDKVFVTVFDTPLDSPDISAPQLQQAIGAVKAGSSAKVDVVGYSMGGLSVRKMLDDGETKVDQVALLGTANRGTRFATLAEYIVQRDIKWAMSLGGISVADLPAMAWLKTWEPDQPGSNLKLDGLNKTFDRQLAGANEFLSIGSHDISTLAKRWGGSAGGDGLVPARSVSLPNLPSKLLEGKGNKHHGNLPHDKDVFATLTDYFGWEKVG